MDPARLRWMLMADQTRRILKDGIHFGGEIFIAPELARIGGRTIEIRYTPHDLRTIEVFTENEWLCTAHPQDQLSRERSEAVILGQAIGNLLDNALRHGGKSIALATREDGDDVVVHVVDDGPGFPAAFLPTAFERFTRADVARGRGGSGLGLAIVAAIAQAHGGRAGAHDAGGGADVWVRLPSRPGLEPAAGL